MRLRSISVALATAMLLASAANASEPKSVRVWVSCYLQSASVGRDASGEAALLPTGKLQKLSFLALVTRGDPAAGAMVLTDVQMDDPNRILDGWAIKGGEVQRTGAIGYFFVNTKNKKSVGSLIETQGGIAGASKSAITLFGDGKTAPGKYFVGSCSNVIGEQAVQLFESYKLQPAEVSL